MKIISLLSQKGGVGKSTLAINIATYFDKFLKTKTVIVDIDPQSSAMSWYDLRDDQSPAVVSCQPSRIESVLSAAKDSGVSLVVIDTPGKIESGSLKAAKVSDYVIVPVKPAFFDLKAVEDTFNVCKLVNKKPYTVLNEIPPNHSVKMESITVLKNMGAFLIETSIGDRIIFKHSIASGVSVNEFDPSSKGAVEVKKLCLEMNKLFFIT